MWDETDEDCGGGGGGGDECDGWAGGGACPGTKGRELEDLGRISGVGTPSSGTSWAVSQGLESGGIGEVGFDGPRL